MAKQDGAGRRAVLVPKGVMHAWPWAGLSLAARYSFCTDRVLLWRPNPPRPARLLRRARPRNPRSDVDKSTVTGRRAAGYMHRDCLLDKMEIGPDKPPPGQGLALCCAQLEIVPVEHAGKLAKDFWALYD